MNIVHDSSTHMQCCIVCWLYILSCLECSLLPNSSHQNLFYLVGPSLNVKFHKAFLVSPGEKWFPILCTYVAHGYPSYGIKPIQSAVYWFIIVRYEYYLFLGCKTQWMVLLLMRWFWWEGTHRLYQFQFRLIVLEGLSLRDDSIFLYLQSNYYEVILYEDHLFSDYDCIHQSDSFRNLSHEWDRLLKNIYTGKKWQLLFYKRYSSFLFLFLFFAVYIPSLVLKGDGEEARRNRSRIKICWYQNWIFITFKNSEGNWKLVYQDWISRVPSL